MNNIIINIYKYIWLIVWTAVIIGAIYYFIRLLTLCGKGRDDSIKYVGRYYDKNDDVFKLKFENSEIKSISFLVLTYFAVMITKIALGFLVKSAFFHQQTGSILDELIRWDSNHYIGIADNWYTGDLTLDRHYHIVFFPMFPIFMRLVSYIGISTKVAGFVVSNMCMVVTIIFMYKLIRIDYSDNIAKTAILLMVFHPYAFFLAFPFTEALFLMLSVLFMYMLRREKWLIAGIIGFMATLTRNFGLLFIIPYGVYLIMLACKRHYNAKQFILKLLPVILIPLGFGVYLYINKVVTGSWFTFMVYQKDHWYQEISCVLKNMTMHFSNLLNNQYELHLRIFLWLGNVASSIALMISIIIKHKKVPFVYNIYALAYLFLTLTASWLLSGARYILACFPMYISYALAIGNKKWLKYIVLAIEYIYGIAVFAGYILGSQIM